jgi:hypothetical protein
MVFSDSRCSRWIKKHGLLGYHALLLQDGRSWTISVVPSRMELLRLTLWMDEKHGLTDCTSCVIMLDNLPRRASVSVSDGQFGVCGSQHPSSFHPCNSLLLYLLTRFLICLSSIKLIGCKNRRPEEDSHSSVRSHDLLVCHLSPFLFRRSICIWKT